MNVDEIYLLKVEYIKLYGKKIQSSVREFDSVLHMDIMLDISITRVKKVCFSCKSSCHLITCLILSLSNTKKKHDARIANETVNETVISLHQNIK